MLLSNEHPSNILSSHSASLNSKLLMSMLCNELQPINIPHIPALDVLNLLTSIEVNELQFSNIPLKFDTYSVLK